MDYSTDKQRTELQNNALHKYFELLADALNNAGLDMRKVLKEDVDIPWNKETVKEYLWRPVQKAQLGKTSTTELKRNEVDKIYETLNRYMAKFGVHEPFPSIDALIEAEEQKKNNK